MTSSSERLPDLPPALSSMWRLCKLGYRHEPRLMIVSFVLSQLSALPDALLALWLMLLGKGVLEHRAGLLLTAAVGLGVSATATWFLRTVSTSPERCAINPAPSSATHTASIASGRAAASARTNETTMSAGSWR